MNLVQEFKKGVVELKNRFEPIKEEDGEDEEVGEGEVLELVD